MPREWRLGEALLYSILSAQPVSRKGPSEMYLGHSQAMHVWASSGVKGLRLHGRSWLCPD